MVDGTQRDSRLQWQGTAVRIIVVDDARLIHEALQAILRRTSSFVISGFARSLAEGARQVSRHRPDMVICEIAIDGESALELCRWLHRTAPLTRVVVLSHHDDMSLAKAAFEAGASAYLLKTVPPDELVQRLRDVMGGLNILDQRLGTTRVADLECENTDRFGLSPREREVLAALSLGLDNRMIAQRLHITHDTVKSHVKSILRKLHARDRTHAVAISLGMAAGVDPHDSRTRDGLRSGPV
jgi:DNA-binding NarL/FixJ family response regulator